MVEDVAAKVAQYHPKNCGSIKCNALRESRLRELGHWVLPRSTG